MNVFEPHPLLRNAHLMTLAGAFWPRRFPRLSPATERLFEVEPGTRILGRCHWQAEPQQRPTLVLVHGLEGSSESAYVLGVAEKAWVAGFNVLRLNQRNCGGTERLARTLYNSGLSSDYRAVLEELIARDTLPEIFFAGYSMGGNLVVKLAGELGAAAPRELRGVAAVAPAIELAACADAIAAPQNFVYEWHFVRSLKQSLRRKARAFPDRFPVDGLGRVRTVREFDEVITAPHFGFRNAEDYYHRSSAVRVIAQIRVSTLILTAQDDPFVPHAIFQNPLLRQNPCISVVAPPLGGHCGFVSRRAGEERFWAEARIVEFCRARSEVLSAT